MLATIKTRAFGFKVAAIATFVLAMPFATEAMAGYRNP
jgi:hypothetical protein